MNQPFSTMIDFLRRFLKRVLRRIVGDSKKSNEDRINAKNRGTINFIDIGSDGILPKPWLQRPELIHHLVKFEPRNRPATNKNVISIDKALWCSNEERPFYIYKGFNHTGSSLFKQNFQYVRDNFDVLKKKGPPQLADTWFDRSALVGEERLNCMRLDDVLEQYQLKSGYDFIKIDAQGAEFQILQGAGKVLNGSCIGLHLELFTIPLYEGIVLLDEVAGYLSRFGFTLEKKFPPHGSFDSQHDCLFLKNSTNQKDKLALIRNLYNL